MPAIRVNDIDLYYEAYGEGPPLFLIMGLRRNLTWWYRQIPELSRHFQVVAFDNRGAGRSDKPVMAYSIGLFADDTAERLNRIDVPVLIAAGDDDPLVPSVNSTILKELIPHAELCFFPGCRHSFFIEAAEAFNRRAIQFFGTVE
jgi:pimeloyl-ACP methyl ester carboxylesterase